jgi:predicted Rossmann fold nucleotide-binding protein DprA/Smf involved in DNA uptake
LKRHREGEQHEVDIEEASRKGEGAPRLEGFDFELCKSNLAQLIEALMQHDRPVSKAKLVAVSKLPIEALDEALLDLERNGIVSKDPTGGSYRLRVLE